MKLNSLVVAFSLCTGFISGAANAADTSLTAKEAESIAYEAYVYGYGIVENYKAIFGMSVFKKSPMYSGFNHYRHSRDLYTPEFKTVVSPNNDTLYSTTFADLRQEPLVIQAGPTGDRYFSIQLVDMLTNNIAYIGTRATGNKGGKYLLVGPDFKGAINSKAFDRVIVSQSPFVALATRTGVAGPADLPEAHKIQDNIQLTGYEAYTGRKAQGSKGGQPMPVYNPDNIFTPQQFSLL